MERFQAAGEEVDFDPFEGEEPAQAEPAPPAAAPAFSASRALTAFRATVPSLIFQ